MISILFFLSAFIAAQRETINVNGVQIEYIYNLKTDSNNIGNIVRAFPCIDTSITGNITIPEKINGKNVTEIREHAFSYTNINNISFPNTIRFIREGCFSFTTQITTVDLTMTQICSIPQYSFQNSSIKYIYLPQSVNVIHERAFEFSNIEVIDTCNVINFGMHAFTGCKNLRFINATLAPILPKGLFTDCKNLNTVLLSNNITFIPKDCFRGSGIVNITLSSVVEIIDEHSFYDCRRLKSICFPNKTKKIENKAFANCVNLESVDLSKTSIQRLSSGLFKNCASLKDVKFAPSTEFLEEKVFFGCGFIQIVFPKNLTTACKECFALCTELKYVDMSQCHMKIIPVGMFRMCTDLEDIIFSKDTFKLSEFSFELCGSLKHLNINNSGISIICDYAFHSCTELSYINFPTGLSKISDGVFHSIAIQTIKFAGPVYSIGRDCFFSCHRLRKVDLRLARIKELPSSIFADCIRLGEIILPESLTSIGGHAFAFTAISALHLPSSIQKIGVRAFEGSQLEEIDLSQTQVQKLRGTFKNCKKLKSFTPPSCLRYIEDGFLSGTSVSFAVPSTVTDIGCSALENSSFAGGIISENVTLIAQRAFANCRHLKSIDLSFTNVKKIYPRTFLNAPLKSIRWPHKLTSIGERFLENTSMYEIKFPDTLKEIEDGAFIGCSSVIIDLSKCINLVQIPKNVFRDLKRLENVRLPDTPAFKKISDCAFMNSGITIFFVPDSLQTLGHSVFANCHSLTKIDLSRTKLTSISSAVFFNSSLNSIQLPSTVTTIEKWALAMSDLTEFIGWNNLESIEPFALYWCHRLVNLDFINSNLKMLSSNLCTCCKDLRTVYIGSKTTVISKLAFANCTSLEFVNLNKTSVSVMKDGAFANCTKLVELELGLYTVEIGDYCFYNCSIDHIKFGSMLATMGKSCFESCRNLKEIDLVHSHLEVISKSTFQNCISLVSINLSPYLREFGHQAFFNIGISTLKLPTFIQKLDRNCFANCKNLIEVDISKPALKSIPYGLFANCTKIHSINLPITITHLDCLPEMLFVKECPVYDNFWDGKSNRELDKGSFDTVGYTVDVNREHIPMPGTFLNNVGLDLISLQNTRLNATEMYMFFGCTNLKVVSLPATIRHIGYASFAKSGVESINLDENITEICSFAFHGCESLEIIGLENTQIKKVSSYALSFLPSLKSLKLPQTVERICEGALFNTTLPEFTFPKSTKYIEKSAFAFTTVDSLDMSETEIEDIPDFAFYNCKASDIKIPPKLRSIGDKGLASTNIKEFEAPESLTEIGFFALAGNNKLKKVNMSMCGVTRLPYCSFASNHVLSEVILPSGLLDIDDTAFFDCPSLKLIHYYGCTEITVSNIFPEGAKVYVLESYLWKSFCGIRVELYYDTALEHFIGKLMCSSHKPYVHYIDDPIRSIKQNDPILLSYYEKE